MMARTAQPKCHTCNHSQSFHEDRTGRCYAFGCQCEAMAKKAAKKKVT